MSDSVHFKNARALAEGAKQDRARHEELVLKVAHLERQLVMVQTEVVSLRQQMGTMYVARGLGRTDKG